MTSNMKVLFVANQFGHFRHMESVAEASINAGCDVIFLFGKSLKKDITDRSI